MLDIDTNKIYEMKDLLHLKQGKQMILVEKDRNKQKKLIGHEMDRYEIIEIIEDDVYIHELGNDGIPNKIQIKGIIYIKMVDPKK